MKKLQVLFLTLCLSIFAHASSGQAYLERFMDYSQWNQSLPEEPDDKFLVFISDDQPLGKKLREKWLYQLANQKDWTQYSKYYKPSEDVNLQCYAHLADYYQGKTTAALAAAVPLWLYGSSRPSACDQLFDLLIHSEGFDENLISQRIALALDKRNLPLARYLLKKYKTPRLKDEQLLIRIYQSPTRITQLEDSELHDDFYLYGLKRLVSINMDQAIKYWRHVKTRKLLSEAQQQAFLAHVALYKAMRNHNDAYAWFAKVKPAYYNDVLLDWQIRFALKRHQWHRVERLIRHNPDKDNPCWQYWLARSLDALGQREKAREIYTSLAETRNYYGFLASLRLNKKPSFQNEKPHNDLSILKPYQPVTDNIKALYNSSQALQASRLVNDFVSELPKADKSALAYWIANDLRWPGKSVYLGNSDELHNQLSLRFPLAYSQAISHDASQYHIPKELIYAIIRQESGFRENVVSSAGAHGLMQVLPTTARMVARANKVPYSSKTELFSSRKNISLGVAYLNSLARRFGNHPVLMAAAYNAGPRQVTYWLKNHPPKEIDLWIETLPWHETRNYLKNVIAFYAVYQYRLQKKIDLSDFMKPLSDI
ncbi:lytic transglycosylase domain-containing protein [Legionella spiritensis]|uniref:lytic transglycosylase domain-containing protein n=1 Tax=Legionella spiritensis TaxID=452 RepID=UPI000F71A5B1|nr:lytic transglycosylase domain-containing protein [Legionella spiritensis]VEG89628.1 soluble lytic murein transglycosylase [Legionella spiritensis]